MTTSRRIGAGAALRDGRVAARILGAATSTQLRTAIAAASPPAAATNPQ